MSVRVLALVCSVFLCVCFSPLARAQSDPQPLSERIWWRSSHNKLSAEVNRVLGNTPSSATPASSTGAAAKGFSIANQANQWPSLRAKTPAPLPSGYSRPVIDVEARVVPSSAAGAIGRFLRKGVPLLSTGFALYDLGQELGFGLDNSSGQLQITKTVTTWGWRAGTAGHVYKPSIAEACNQVLSFFTGGYLLYEISATQDRVVCTAPENPAGSQYTFNKINQGTTTTPQTIDQFEDAIEAKTGWPTNSAINLSLAAAIAAGEGVQTQTPTVTGPATTPGPVSTTTDAVNNTTTTSTTTYNHTYSGDTVTTTSTTTNITINNTTGSVVNSTTTTTSPVFPEVDKVSDEGVPTDKALPGQPKLYEPKYPDGLTGVWNSKKAQLDSAPLVALLSDLMPTVSSSGTCPVWLISLDFDIANFGTHDVAPPCWLWDFARAVLIACALLLARRLVFGG